MCIYIYIAVQKPTYQNCEKKNNCWKKNKWSLWFILVGKTISSLNWNGCLKIRKSKFTKRHWLYNFTVEKQGIWMALIWKHVHLWIPALVYDSHQLPRDFSPAKYEKCPPKFRSSTQIGVKQLNILKTTFLQKISNLILAAQSSLPNSFLQSLDHFPNLNFPSWGGRSFGGRLRYIHWPNKNPTHVPILGEKTQTGERCW